MKTLYFYLLIGLLMFISCKTKEDQALNNVSFEINETVVQNELPGNLLEEFRSMKIKLNTDTLSPIIAFVNIDSTELVPTIENDKVKFLTTIQPVDNEKRYMAIVAVKKQTEINLSDIKKTNPNQNNIEIYFNLLGAKKWSAVTKNNIGKMIAFTIDNKIYTLTSVNGEIKSGTAIITGLENEDVAAQISKSINSGV